MKIKNKKLILENGMVFEGIGFGAESEKVAEIVFNTSMVGYQEIISDPSYYGQMVCMTYPIIGSYGMMEEDFESRVPNMGGIIVKDYNDKPSNFRFTKTLNDVLKQYSIPGISGIDTRALTRIIRSEGSMKAIICPIDIDNKDALKIINTTSIPKDHVERVSCKEPQFVRTSNSIGTIVAIDCGIKWNIIRNLIERKCNVVVLPYNASKADVLKYKPDGLFLSNGPGDPEVNKSVIKLVKELQGRIPIFGICLGHQIIALANNAKTYKMKFGHRGANHPVKNVKTKLVEITTQNHSFAVESDSIKKTKFEISHINLLDQTCEGISLDKDLIFSVQYHPESAAGPEDSKYLFDKFINNIKIYKEKNNG